MPPWHAGGPVLAFAEAEMADESLAVLSSRDELTEQHAFGVIHAQTKQWFFWSFM